MASIKLNDENELGQWLNSPELKALREAWDQAEKIQKAEDDAWWDSLTIDNKSQAFRQITKLIYKAEIIDKGSYRHVMYEVFGLDYGDGLPHYMALHNLIHQGLKAEQS